MFDRVKLILLQGTIRMLHASVGVRDATITKLREKSRAKDTALNLARRKEVELECAVAGLEKGLADVVASRAKSFADVEALRKELASTSAMLERTRRERDSALDMNGRTPLILGASRKLEELAVVLEARDGEEASAAAIRIMGEIVRKRDEVRTLTHVCGTSRELVEVLRSTLGGMGAEDVLDAARRVVKERDEACHTIGRARVEAAIA